MRSLKNMATGLLNELRTGGRTMTVTRTIPIGKVFDESGFTFYQYLVCTICFLVTFLDGFDLTVVGVALPKIADHLSSDPGSLGLALSAGQFGPLLGAIVLGMLADRYGRKKMLFISAVCFGIFTYLTVHISSAEQLAACRFLAGIGLGGAVPNALTLGSEYAPRRSRALIVAAMYAGMPAGAMTGGLLAAYIIPNFGWQTLFYLGGCAPLFISALVAFLLPESLEFLARRNNLKDSIQIRKVVARIHPKMATDYDVEFVATDRVEQGGSVKGLFTEGRLVTTLLLWLLCGGALYLLWILNTWSPTLLRNSGATVQQYSLAYAYLCFGAVISSIFIGRLMDRMNPFKVLQAGFILASASLVAFGFGAGSGSFTVIAILSVICGICINGSQTGTLAVATLAYPSHMRATGIGWAYAIAKIGAMAAPLAGGYMLNRNWSVSQLCNVNALVGLFTVGVLVVLRQRIAQTGKEEEDVARDPVLARSDSLS
jgi:AAHS family 4-hydroxybenzoate transporter-like MFS transporter